MLSDLLSALFWLTVIGFGIIAVFIPVSWVMCRVVDINDWFEGRRIEKGARLWAEMVKDGRIKNPPAPDYRYHFNPAEHPGFRMASSVAAGGHEQVGSRHDG